MANNEKNGPLLPSATAPASPAAAPHPGLRKKHPKIFAGLMVYILFRMGYEAHRSFYGHSDYAGATDAPTCAQADVLTPVAHAPLWDTLNEKIGMSSFESSAVNWLAGAVRVPYVSFCSLLLEAVLVILIYILDVHLGPSHMITWTPLASTRAGRCLGHSMNISSVHSLWCKSQGGLRVLAAAAQDD